MYKFWICLLFGVMCWLRPDPACPAQNLRLSRHGSYFFYYSQSESDLAGRLAVRCEDIALFLKSRGLPPAVPLHIILDEELDEPRVRVQLYPHHEIRIPLRAPGVLEDGYLEPDPWFYFLFKGICLEALLSERSGIPGYAGKAFGRVVSPNLILPEWVTDGISHILFERFSGRPAEDPLARAIFDSGPLPRLDLVSNHPERWPGRFSFMIYGRPFIRWVCDRYGWERLLAFVRLHGRGVNPFEIGGKAEEAFGKTWEQLWQDFQANHNPAPVPPRGRLIDGYWPEPFVYWNSIGVHPGLQQTGARSRYGYLDAEGWLWLSSYEKGASCLTRQFKDVVRRAPRSHIWDPGMGEVAVGRRGRRPCLVLRFSAESPGIAGKEPSAEPCLIPAPDGVLQLSGPVRDEQGRIVVAANLAGNWDIWMYSGAWQRLTTAPSVEMDPWLQEGRLLFASNATGRFQIHGADMRPLTDEPGAAVLPRGGSYLQLANSGWRERRLSEAAATAPPAPAPEEISPEAAAASGTSQVEDHPYSPWPSLRPNTLYPDFFIDRDNFQIGAATEAYDVSRGFGWDAGLRYDLDDDTVSWRLGALAHAFRLRATRYPVQYSTLNGITIDEKRYEARLGWTPPKLKALEISANWRHYTPEGESGASGNEWWAAMGLAEHYGSFRALLNADVFDEGSQSVYGRMLYSWGERISTVVNLEGGKTWGALVPGHTTFRIGGNSGEGFFTQRPSRLFPVRGFDADVLEAGLAAAGSVETYWPLASIQSGYKTMPLFLRDIRLGTFVDAGFADNEPALGDMLVSAGFELITGTELAWGVMADFRVGWAWPLVKPDGLEGQQPVFLILIGRPL